LIIPNHEKNEHKKKR